MSGCLSSGDESADAATSANVDGPGEVANVDGFDGSVVKTDHLLTDSRNADVVVWQNDEGTVFADAEDEVIAGSSDFASVMQAAVDAGASKITVQSGHYVAESPVDVDSGTIIEGMGTGTTIEVAGSAGFRVEGERAGAASLTSDANQGDRTVSVADTSPFSADELVLVNTSRTTEYRDQPYGEIRRITDVDAASGKIELTAGGLFDDYRTENDARAIAIDDVENVIVRDLEFVGTDQQAYRTGVVATYGQRINVQNVLFRGLGHSGVIYSSTIYSAVENSKMKNIAYANGGVGYGVTLADAVRNVQVRNNVFHDTKNHCTTVGGSGEDGFPRLLSFNANEYYEDDADVHMGGVVKFTNNRFANGAGGIISGADTTHVSGCTFRNIDGDAIKDRGDPSELVVVDSQFKNVDEMAVNLYDNPAAFRKVTVAANDFTDVDGNVVRFRTPDGATCEFFGVTENVVNGCGSNAFHVSELGDSTVANTNFVGNHFEDVGGFVLAAGGLSGSVRFIGNTASNVGGSYVVSIGGEVALVSNNDIRKFADRGYLIETRGLVAGNTFFDGGNDGILVYDTDDVLVTHNKFDATSGADVNEIDSTNCKVVWNDVESGVDVSGSSNKVRQNFGYQTEDSGTYTTSGSAAYSYEIPHDLEESAVIADVWAESADAAGSFYVSEKDADAITVTYRNAPPSGSNNLTWGYETKTHAH